jgi:molybdopterin/thiamine biosynthesis adenylyltransferase
MRQLVMRFRSVGHHASLQSAAVGGLGLSGAGSQVADRLAQSEVGRLLLADGDVIEVVDLSRSHGARPSLVGMWVLGGDSTRTAEGVEQRAGLGVAWTCCLTISARHPQWCDENDKP